MIRITRADPKWLIGKGTPKFSWYCTTGRMHRVESVIIRWRGRGGTLEAPDVSVIAHCGRQEDMGRILAFRDDDESALAMAGVCRSCLRRVKKLLDNNMDVA